MWEGKTFPFAEAPRCCLASGYALLCALLGGEFAVHGLPNRGDVLVYPANFVAKRWERRETSFP